MRCGLWEFGALVRHADLRHEAEAGTRPRCASGVPAFLTTVTSGSCDQATFSEALTRAESTARAKGWIARGGSLNDQWGEIVTTLARGSDCGFLLIKSPGTEDVRALVSVRQGSAFRVVLRGETMDIDEISARSPWFALAECLPEARPAQGKAMTVPTAVLATASAEAGRHGGDQSEWASYELQLRKIPAITAKVVGAWTKRADPVTAQVSIAVRNPDDSLRVGPFTIDIHHAPSGRVATFPRPPLGEETTVAPGSHAVVANAVQHYLDDLRAGTGS